MSNEYVNFSDELRALSKEFDDNYQKENGTLYEFLDNLIMESANNGSKFLYITTDDFDNDVYKILSERYGILNLKMDLREYCKIRGLSSKYSWHEHSRQHNLEIGW